MRTPVEHLALLKRRAEYLRERVTNSPRANDYDRAEMATLDWVLIQLEAAPQYHAMLKQVESLLETETGWHELELSARALREKLIQGRPG